MGGYYGIERKISIHALHEEGDDKLDKIKIQPYKFLSTPSMRRATVDPLPTKKAAKFLSTPSMRRATASTRTVASPVFYFYPRPP